MLITLLALACAPAPKPVNDDAPPEDSGGDTQTDTQTDTQPQADTCAEDAAAILQGVTELDSLYLAGAALKLDLLNQPEQLEQADWAAMSAAHYWDARGLNALADAGAIQDIGSIINTGQPGKVPNGAEDRKALYEKALKVLA